jgi:hypothetical protein
MGFRFKSDHLICSACGAAITPLNRRGPNHEPVTHILTASYPGWDADGAACEECVNEAYGRLTKTGLIDRLRSRLKGRGETQSIQRYRTSETV